MAAILFSGVEPSDQTVNILPTEGPMWNLVKIVQEVSEKTTFEDFTTLFINITQGQGQITPRILTVDKQFYFFNYKL